MTGEALANKGEKGLLIVCQKGQQKLLCHSCCPPPPARRTEAWAAVRRRLREAGVPCAPTSWQALYMRIHRGTPGPGLTWAQVIGRATLEYLQRAAPPAETRNWTMASK